MTSLYIYIYIYIYYYSRKHTSNVCMYSTHTRAHAHACIYIYIYIYIYIHFETIKLFCSQTNSWHMTRICPCVDFMLTSAKYFFLNEHKHGNWYTVVRCLTNKEHDVLWSFIDNYTGTKQTGVKWLDNNFSVVKGCPTSSPPPPCATNKR